MLMSKPEKIQMKTAFTSWLSENKLWDLFCLFLHLNHASYQLCEEANSETLKRFHWILSLFICQSPELQRFPFYQMLFTAFWWWEKLLNAPCKHNMLTNTLFCGKRTCKEIFNAPKRNRAPVLGGDLGAAWQGMAARAQVQGDPFRLVLIHEIQHNYTNVRDFHHLWEGWPHSTAIRNVVVYFKSFKLSVGDILF